MVNLVDPAVGLKPYREAVTRQEKQKMLFKIEAIILLSFDLKTLQNPAELQKNRPQKFLFRLQSITFQFYV